MKLFTQVGKKIIGVGRNYKCHIEEMGQSMPEKPFYFLKPSTSYVSEPNSIHLPSDTLVEHEVELGVIIGKSGKNIKRDSVMEYIAGYCVAIDLTARDIQREEMKKGLPWTVSKGYDTFCPVSNFIPKMMLKNPHDATLWLKVNGELKQKGNTSNMIFKIPELIETISSVMKLEDGDLIITGTPAGVGPVKLGDTITAGIGHDFVKMQFRCVPRPFSNM